MSSQNLNTPDLPVGTSAGDPLPLRFPGSSRGLGFLISKRDESRVAVGPVGRAVTGRPVGLDTALQRGLNGGASWPPGASCPGLVGSSLVLLPPAISPPGVLWPEALRVQASWSSSCKMTGSQRMKFH